MTHRQLGIRLALLLLIVAAPILPFTLLWPGVVGVALFGVLVAVFAWISGGARVAIPVTVALALLGILGIVCRDHTWLLALILLLLGIGYGVAASRGIGSAVLQLPILVPYFMMRPPPLFTDGPAEVTPLYLLAVGVIVVLAGLWTVLVLRKAMGRRALKVVDVADPRAAIVHGTVLGVLSAIVVTIAQTSVTNLHWVWVTLTLYLLANPTGPVNAKKMLYRVLGTFAGFVVVGVLLLTGLPHLILVSLAVVSLWACLFFYVAKRPYWQYVVFLTITVVLMDSSDASTVVLDAERIGFTVLGALLAIGSSFVVNLLMFRRRHALADEA